MSKEPNERPTQAMYKKWSHPHAGDPRVDPEARAGREQVGNQGAPAPVNRRKLNEGLLDSEFPEETQSIEVVEQTVPAAVNVAPREMTLIDRALRFERDMPLFEVKPDPETGGIIIPRTMEEAQALFLGRLPMSLELKIDRDYLYRGKRGGTAIKRAGKSLFGAFTVALYPTTDEDGRDVDIQVLADMTHRRLRKNNEVVRFRQETSSLYYYAKEPRISSRR